MELNFNIKTKEEKKMKTLKFEIENHTEHDSSIESLALTFAKSTASTERERYNEMNLMRAIYFTNLITGMGGHHIWFKAKNDIEKRLAIIYL